MIKLVYFCVTCYFVHLLVSNVDSFSVIVQYVGYVVMLAWISWQSVSVLYKIVTEKFLPRVNPQEKAVLITGCDSGLGQEYVWTLSSYGFQIFAGCLFPDGEGARSLLERAHHPDRIHIIGIDVTKDECVKKAVEEVASILKRESLELYGVINNAGVGATNVFEWSDIETDLEKTFQVNVFGVMKVCQSFLPLLRKCAGSRIINIASIAGREGVPQQGPCCSSKASVIAFSTTLRRELRTFGIKVITIEPYFYATGLNSFTAIKRNLDQGWESASEESKNVYGQEYLDSWLNYYENILCKTYCKDFKIVSQTILKSLTNHFPEQVYVAIPFIQGMIIWLHLTLVPLHIHDLLYKLLDQFVKWSYRVSPRYQVTSLEKSELSCFNLSQGNKRRNLK